jgi:DNA-binding CsgD family transcriptional regulator
VASAGGNLVDLETLEEVVQLNTESIEGAVREALAANVLSRHPRGIAFRHALLRDAVYDDLLPTEKKRLHAQYFQVLTRRLGAATVEVDRWRIGADLAAHAAATGDVGAAVRAHVVAARAARALGLRADAAAHYEAALASWDDAPVAARPADVAKPDLARLAADCRTNLGQPEPVERLLREAIALVDDETDPLVASRVYATAATLNQYLSDVHDDEAAARALELAGLTPSVERAEALTAMAHVADRHRQFRQVLEHVRVAREVAVQVGATSLLHRLRTLESFAQWDLGHCGEGIESMREASALARGAGDPLMALEDQTYLAGMSLLLGHTDHTIETVASARAEARRLGILTVPVQGTVDDIYALIYSGRLDEAKSLLNDLRNHGLVEFRIPEISCELELALGDLNQAARHDERATGESGDAPFVLHEQSVVRRSALLGARGDFDSQAHWALRFVTESVDPTDSVLVHPIAAYVCLSAIAGAAAQHSSPARDAMLLELRTRGYHSLARARSDPAETWTASWYGIYLSLAEGFAAQLEGRYSIPSWIEASERAERIGAYLALQPRLALAAEQLRTGDRSSGKEQLVAVWHDARTMGALGYLGRAETVATHHRVALPEHDDTAGPLNRLTPREREVLALLAQGSSDKDIAHTLVISPRTASIHVGNILSKLQTPNRGAAAALARELVVRSSPKSQG